ncbi:MAG: hypothetical protein ABIR87_03760 [Sphingomicrobium sp.]
MITARSGVSIAATAALLALSALTPTAPALASHHAAKVHCYGVNTCKGTSDCKTAKNDCKGLNDCKGHGFKELTAQQCTTAGGSLKEI